VKTEQEDSASWFAVAVPLAGLAQLVAGLANSLAPVVLAAGPANWFARVALTVRPAKQPAPVAVAQLTSDSKQH